MEKLKEIILKIATLSGSSHNIAMGTAVGVFIAVTPTIPFHTALAILFAIVLRGSKRAAIIAVWFSNPITIPIFYAGSYYAGIMLLGIEHSNIQLIYDLMHTLESGIPFGEKMDAIGLFLKAELPVFYAMMLGGAVLGLPPAIGSYFLARNWVKKFRNKKEKED